jgi:N-acetylglucosaminyldiphosphoundecaprenol N-acetyl-beta-D-mannosaminyltransferase
MNRISFLGYPVDSLNIDDALKWMEKSIKHQSSNYITVVNANKFWQSSKSHRLANIIRNADLVLPEWAVYWGSKKARKPLKDFVCGIELFKASLPWAAKKGYRIFFLGATPKTITALQQRLEQIYPNLEVAGYHHGYLRTEQEALDICWQIRLSNADILYVAMGSPRQEFWIEEHLKQLKVPVIMGVGGSFDVVAGIKSDTPNWARGHGIEWLYRLLQDPKTYWKRYMITNPWFVLQVAKERARSIDEHAL